MRRFRWAFALVSLGAACLAVAQNPVKRVSDPALSPDGQTIAFVWQGDIWTVPYSGGVATRLTVHEAIEAFPLWTRDGQRIVFASNRFGNNDVFSMARDGSDVRRLTHQSSDEYPNSVAPDGTVYGYSSAWGRLDLFMVGANGGDVVRLTQHPLEMEYYADVSPDGSKIAFNTAGSAGNWRRPGHTGSNTDEIWVTDRMAGGAVKAPLTDYRQVTKNNHLDLFPRFISETELVCVSNPEGSFHNLYRVRLDGRRTKLTQFTEGTIRAVSVSIQTQKAVYQRNSEIWATDLASGQSRTVRIEAPADSRRNAVVEYRADSGLSNYAVSPDNKRTVVEVRGDLFLLPAGGGTTVRLTTDPGPDSSPFWLDNTTLVYVAAGEGSKRTLRKMTVGEVTSTGQPPASTEVYSHTLDAMAPVVSPDRKWIAFHRGNRELCVMPAGGGTATVVLQSDFMSAFYGSPQFAWSPDNEWLAVVKQLQRSVQVVLVKRDGSQQIVVAKAGKSASTPTFSPDGKHLIFGVVEGLDYSETRIGGRVVPTIVDLVPVGFTFGEDDIDDLGSPAERPAGQPVKVEVLEEGIFDRKRTVSGSFGGAWMVGESGSTVYANINNQLVRINLATGSASPVGGVTGAASSVAQRENRLYVVQNGRLFWLNNANLAPVNFNAVARVDVQAEENALFNEAWWALDRMFYDPQKHGRDWNKIRTDFAELVPHATSRQDFYDLMGEMVQRLDSSHQGATSSETYRSSTPESTAWFGVEWDSTELARGRYVVSKVYLNTPAAHPDSKLEVGDRVTAVNGTAPSAQNSMAELLRGQVGRKVVLTVDRSGASRTVEIKPVSSGAFGVSGYDDWVRWNRNYVSEKSNGEFGYIHIQSMDAPSLNTFLTEIATEAEGKKGMIIDVRYNGGGFTSHIILNILRKEPWLIRTSPDMPGLEFSENMYRGNSLELPIAALTNEYSFSNAEIFSEGVRRMRLGPVVGETTGAGVIGTSAYGFWDGGMIRMPSSGAYTVEGENLEGIGRRPDFEISWDPNWANQGRDPQLDKAVEELRKRLR